MTPAKRLQDASCAICMESLFCKVDDLDVVLPITAPDCGHVFHEECLGSWFQCQTNAYLDAERDDGNPNPSEEDAPIQCPTCREEVYAKNDGQPDIHRLFINFGDDTEPTQTQIAGSSGGSKESEDHKVFALARRAREASDAVAKLGAHSVKQEVDATIRKVEGLSEDLVSVKAITGVKTYIGGLTRALGALQSTLETHPVIHDLQRQVVQLENRNKQTEADMRDLVQKTLPEQVRKAVEAERGQAERKAARVESSFALVRHELSKESVAKKLAVKSLDTLKEESAKTIASIKRQLEEETQRANALSANLYERTKQLKALQAKAESRKELKNENEQLRAEVARLRCGQSQPASRESINDDRPSAAEYAMQSSMADNDQSLSIDFSFQDSMATLSSPPKRPVGTSRTFACDIDDDIFGSKKSHPKSSASRKGKSKYFTPSRSAGSSRSAASDDPSQCLVPPSSSPQAEVKSPRSIRVGAGPSVPAERKKRGNPFVSTREESDKRKALHDREIVDLTESPEFDRKAHISSDARQNITANPLRTALAKPLALADPNGRPLKHLMSGPKARRR